MFDVMIVGAGPAGQSAALILGRSCRKVLILDTGVYRNAASQAMHGFLSRDGVAPLEFLEITRAQLTRYDTVTYCSMAALDARRSADSFEVILADGKVERSRRLLIATGVVDELPPIDHIRDFYGKSVFHCPYCDGWEVRGGRIAVFANGEASRRLRARTHWMDPRHRPLHQWSILNS